MAGSVWDKRIRRVDDLIDVEPAAREVLTFYRHILEVQRRIADDLLRSPKSTPPLQDRGCSRVGKRPYAETSPTISAPRSPSLSTISSRSLTANTGHLCAS